MARDHRERNKQILEDQRRDNAGNLISVCVLVLPNIFQINALFYYQCQPAKAWVG